jgi:hypothetical protein
MAKMLKFLYVTWIDAADPNATGWESEKDVKEFGNKDTTVESGGFEVARNKHYLTLVADYISSNDSPSPYSRPTKIPIGTILQEKVLFKLPLK